MAEIDNAEADGFREGQMEEAASAESDRNAAVSVQANVPPAKGGVDLIGGTFLDQNTVYQMILNDEPPLPSIPKGRKDDVAFRIDNSFNRKRVESGKNAAFSDDCGAWTSCSSKKNFFVVMGKQVRHVDFKDNVYFHMVRGHKVPIEPQPSESKILVMRRYYSTLKGNPDFRRRMTLAVKFPANVKPRHDVYVAEYTGNMTPQVLPHGNTKVISYVGN